MPSRASTPAGSSRSPYISRFTARWASERNGISASAAATAAMAAATVPDSRSPLTNIATSAAYPATSTAITVHVDQRPVGQALDVEQPVPAQRHRDAEHERQPGEAVRARRQQLVPGDQLRHEPERQTRARRSTAPPAVQRSRLRVNGSELRTYASTPNTTSDTSVATTSTVVPV